MGLADERRRHQSARRRSRYNGTIFLNNTGGIIQALDGKTGDLIWEQRLGVNIAMRGMTLYDDKLYLALSNAHLVALDARTGEVAWDVAMPDGRGSSSGPLVAKGKVIQGMGGCQQYVEQKCFISAYDAETGKQLWRFNTVRERRRAWRRHLGQPLEPVPRRRRDVDHRQLRSGSESHVLGHGAGQAVDAGQPRHVYARQGALHELDVALDVDTGKLAWHYSHAPGEALDLDVVFERVLVDSGGQNLVFTVGKDGVLWKLDRKTGKYLGHKETVFQNVWESFDPQDRRAALPRRTSSTTKSASGSTAARAPRAATTGRR